MEALTALSLRIRRFPSAFLLRTSREKFTRGLYGLLLIFLFILSNFLFPVRAVEAADPCSTAGVVCVFSAINTNTVWDSSNIYYVIGDVHVTNGTTLTIPGGTIVKFDTPLDPGQPNALLSSLVIDKGAVLAFQDTNPTDGRVLFTSGRDDTSGGDTNGDENQTIPDLGDWEGLILVDRDPGTVIENLTFRYSKDGLNIRSSTQGVSPTVQNVAFYESTCGLTLSAASTYNNQTSVRDNLFQYNKYGLCTSATSTGQVLPSIQNNDFIGNTTLPIYLFGTSYPTYSGNVFTGTGSTVEHLGIGLGGRFYGSGTWTVVDDMPFVVVTPVDIDLTGSVTVTAGTVVKFFTQFDIPVTTPPQPLPKISVYGTFNLSSTEAEPIIFTSYRDDTVVGDTNGDGDITEGYAGDWDAIYYRDNAATGATNLTIQYLEIRNAKNGIFYDVTSNATRSPTFRNITFKKNVNGLRLKAIGGNQNSRLESAIEDCTFEENGIIPINKNQTEPGVPIFLENVVQPAYINNIFTNNKHPAIGVAGSWRSSATWTAVSGNDLTPMPYLVHGDTQIGNLGGNLHDDAVTLTIPAGSVIKFNVNIYDRTAYKSKLTVSGILAVESNPAVRTVFTSYYDNAYGGDTSSEPVPPAKQDWGDVLIRNRLSNFDYTIFRYGDKALHLQSHATNTGYVLDQDITHSRFESNEFGVYLDVQNVANITPLIENNVFSQNSYGLGTFARNTLTSPSKATGMSVPVIRLNTFELSSQFPIYLNGSATLEFLESNNIFQNNAHRAIALGGYFGGISHSSRFPRIAGDVNHGGQTFPYVVWASAYFDWNTIAWVDSGLVYKFNDNVELRYYGRLDHNALQASPNYYTSYRDDYYDDTNGTPNPNPAPTRGVWKGVYVSNPNTASFSYSTIKWADQGLVLFQNGTQNIQPTITGSTFTENRNGLTCQIESSYDVLSQVGDNTFVSNDHGFHTYTNAAIPLHDGSCNPTLNANRFQLHSEFPIYLQGSADPVYINNLFWDNTHPAIALGGVWSRDATWTLVYDNTLSQMMPYVVKENVSQEYYLDDPTITIPADTIVKLMDGKYIYAWSLLDLESSPTHEIVFTSYRDDFYAGDINHDGATTPPRSAWKTVWLLDFPGKVNHIHDVIVQYGTAGLGVYYDGPENTQATTHIERARMENNSACIALVIGWRQVNVGGQLITYPGAGNIQATLTDILMRNSDYGLLTVAMDKATGVIQPSLANITFQNIAHYPIYLGGTSYPSFVEGNTITQDLDFSSQEVAAGSDSIPEIGQVSIEGMDLPGNKAAMDSIQPGLEPLSVPAQPQSALAAGPDLAPAMGLAGAWNNSGTLPSIPGIPYAVVGNFPLTVAVGNVNYTPANDVTIGVTNPTGYLATVTVPSGTVFKFNPSRMLTVKGALSLLSTPSQPVIFTSMKDDSAGGDTNEDGSLTKPAKGDWGEIQFAYGSPDFHNAVVRYANNGLHLFFDGADNLNIDATVAESIFINNNTGLTLTAKKMGDVIAAITQNSFRSNGTHIYGNPSDAGNDGSLCITASNNDLWGDSAQNGIDNRNVNGTEPVSCPEVAFDARYNYWGSDSGPTHPGNPGGSGSRVSDRVVYNPWLGSPVIPSVTYSIIGQVTRDTSLGDGMNGVTMVLQGQSTGTALTDADGYYRFEDLEEGSYILYPSLQGYMFNPPSISVTINSGDATGLNFVGIISPADVAISISSVTSFRPAVVGQNKSCLFNVSLNKALDAGKTASVHYYTADGTAISGQDYTAKNGTLTFLAGQTLVQSVSVGLLPGASTGVEEYFNLILDNPVNATFSSSVGTCTIVNAEYVYIPIVRK